MQYLVVLVLFLTCFSLFGSFAEGLAILQKSQDWPSLIEYDDMKEEDRFISGEQFNKRYQGDFIELLSNKQYKFILKNTDNNKCFTVRRLCKNNKTCLNNRIPFSDVLHVFDNFDIKKNRLNHLITVKVDKKASVYIYKGKTYASSLCIVDTIIPKKSFLSSIFGTTSGRFKEQVTSLVNEKLEKLSQNGANSLANLDFYHAHIINADLSNANFFKSDLKFAIFENTKLNNATLEKSDLQFSSFIKSPMRFVNLKDSVVQGTYFYDIDFYKTNIQNVSFEKCTLIKADFSYMNLSNINFESSKIMASFFASSNLDNANFKNTKMGSVYFKDSRLINADFNNSDLYNVNLENTNLTNANFAKAVFLGTSLIEAINEGINLDHARFKNPAGHYLREIDLTWIPKKYKPLIYNSLDDCFHVKK